MSAFGKALFNFAQSARLKRTKLHLKQVQIGNHVCTYLDSQPDGYSATPTDASKTDIVAMIHGFSSDKLSWAELYHPLAQLSKKEGRAVRVLIPDLLGHGDTTPQPADGDYRIPTQVEFVEKFFQAVLGAARLHLIGTSMGGYIVGMFAATYPQRLHSLSMLCPAGVKAPEKSVLVKVKEETGQNVLIPADEGEMKAMIHYIFERPPWLPKPVLRHMIALRNERQEIITKIMEDLIQSPQLNNYLRNIQCPTALLWGKSDKIIDVSSVEVFKAEMRTLEILEIYEGCGHAIALERPLDCAKGIMKVIQKARSLPAPANELPVGAPATLNDVELLEDPEAQNEKVALEATGIAG